MSLSLPGIVSDLGFADEIERASGLRVADCYQCGKCTAGCPVAFSMDYPPSQILRGTQMGLRDLILSSRAIWLCTACETCSTRCPQEVDPAGVIDALRRIAYTEGVRSPEKNVPLFHRIFLGSVRLFGRQFEAGLMGLYNVLSGHFTKDVLMAPKMLLSGKLGLLPPRPKNRKELKRIFAAVEDLEADAR